MPDSFTSDEIEARVTINIRYPVTLDVEAAKERMRIIAGEFDVKPNGSRWWSRSICRKIRILISTLMNVYNEATGLSGEALAIGGGTYARSLPNICGFGPAFPGDPDVPHQANEWMSVDSLLAGAVIYREALRRLAD